jgi:hypothetical protein
MNDKIKHFIATLLICFLFSTTAFADTWEPKEDKALHVGAGVVLGYLSYCVYRNALHLSPNVSLVLSSLTGGTLAGIVKETMDRGNGGEFSVPDIGYTTLGGVLGSGIAFTFDGRFRNWQVVK